MNEPGKHYAMWNKPDTERQILHDLAYMWNNKKKSQTHRNSSKTVPGVRGEGEIGRGWQKSMNFQL